VKLCEFRNVSVYLASFRINYGASLSLLVDNLPRMSVCFLFYRKGALPRIVYLVIDITY
jgi:hypothetical protein